MPKFHVVLDTNIYRKSPRRKDLDFQALERLAKAGIIQLHLPYVVEREFQTQQAAQYKKEIDAAISGLNSVTHKGLEPAQLEKIQGILETLKIIEPKILADVERSLPNWVTSINGYRHPLTEAQATSAMEAYFQGSAPLKAPKVRDDIPDSFIFQLIVELAKTSPPLVVVADDAKIAQASEMLDGVLVHRNLTAFIKSDSVHAELLELDIVQNLPYILNAIKSYEIDSGNITHLLEQKGGLALLWKKVYSLSIPDDNHEATITSHYDPEDIELDFTELRFYGHGDFCLPFTFVATVSIVYYIFKSDYFTLDEKRKPSVSDHNDHYYEAEEDKKVRASGVIKLSFDPAALKSLSIENIEEQISVDIDSIDEVVLEDDD